MVPRPDAESLSVVHLLAPATFGGLESVVAGLAAGQAEAGARVAIGLLLSPGSSWKSPLAQSLEATGIPLSHLEFPPRAYLAERRAVGALLARWRPQVLHTHGYRPDVLHAPLARTLGVGRVSTVHGFTGGGLRNRIYEWIQRRALRRFDAVVVVSEALRTMLEAGGVPASRLHLVPNALKPAGTLLDRASARDALGLPPEGAVVGWVGRFTQEKGPDQMIRAFQGLDPTVSLSLLGSGPMRGGLEDLAGNLGISKRIRWHGTVPNAASFLRAFDLVCLSSWTEGTPMVLLEAMAAETPVVATSVGGIPDVVSGDEALLVPPGDPSAMAEAMRATLADPAAARRRAEAASARLTRDFGVDQWLNRYRDVYRAALSF